MGSARDESDWKNYRDLSAELRSICVEAIAACDELPAEVRDNRNAASGIRITNFDQSYIEFLSGQIEFEPRGPEWNQRLIRRREALTKLVGRELARCTLRSGRSDYSFHIDPLAGAVVYWEAYDEFYKD